jgi:hypothetical protein
MTSTARDVHGAVEAVWAVLADAHAFSDWVVGAKEIRAVEEGWPSPGSHFHHTVGWGPFTLQDDTKSLEAVRPRRLVVEARGRPLGRARVALSIEPSGDRTRVTMEEAVTSPTLLRWCNPFFAPLIRLRNAESLRRLAQLVEGGAA